MKMLEVKPSYPKYPEHTKTQTINKSIEENNKINPPVTTSSLLVLKIFLFLKGLLIEIPKIFK